MNKIKKLLEEILNQEVEEVDDNIILAAIEICEFKLMQDDEDSDTYSDIEILEKLLEQH